MCLVSRNRSIISNSQNTLTPFLMILHLINTNHQYSLHTIFFLFNTLTTKIDHIANISSFYFPRIAKGEPKVWIFHLPPVFNLVFKQTIVVANTISPSYSSKTYKLYHICSLWIDYPCSKQLIFLTHHYLMQHLYLH